VKIDWKMVTRELVEMHQDIGSGCVDLEGEVPTLLNADIEAVTPDKEMYVTDGELTAKKVRGWLWHQRKSDWMPGEVDRGVVVYSASLDEGVVVGIGRMTETE